MAIALPHGLIDVAKFYHPLLGSPLDGMSFDPPQLPPGYNVPGAVIPSPFGVDDEGDPKGRTTASQTHPPANKKRRSSKGKLPSEIKRSVSTPHMRNLAAADSGALSPTTDKRRNKLGYHRTSVACGKLSCLWRRIRILQLVAAGGKAKG